MIKITIPYEVIYKKNDRYNKSLAKRLQDGLMLGIIENPCLDDNDVYHVEVHNNNRLKVKEVLAIVALGGSVEGFKCIIKIPAAELTSLVPEAFHVEKQEPNSWENWHDGLHSWFVYNDVAYIPTDNLGRLLTADELARLALAGIDLISIKEFLTVREAHKSSLENE